MHPDQSTVPGKRRRRRDEWRLQTSNSIKISKEEAMEEESDQRREKVNQEQQT